MKWRERRESLESHGRDSRSDGDRDYARVIHSASFRRLQGKTQILNLGDSDFYRTRLTHSLEVAQISGGITQQLERKYCAHQATKHLPNHSMIHAIGCTHDLGHPPFGHGGEVALNYCMRKHGGFEGNGQTLRILSRLENFSKNAGANLSRRTLLGVLKYPVSYSRAFNSELVPSLFGDTSAIKIINSQASKPPKCYMDSEQDVVDWIFDPLSATDREQFQRADSQSNKHAKAKHKSLDCSIMDVADDIAYGVHDLEDAISLRLLTKEDILEAIRGVCLPFISSIQNIIPNKTGNGPLNDIVNGLFEGGYYRKWYIGRFVNYFISSINYIEFNEFESPILRYRAKINDEGKKLLDSLKGLVSDKVIKSPSVQHLEFKGQGMVVSVFEAMEADPKRLLPVDILKKFEDSKNNRRIICDYVAGMTDTYLLKTYERLFSPRMGSVFDKL